MVSIRPMKIAGGFILALYVTTGVGAFGPRALAANHAVVGQALTAFEGVVEGYFEAHPIVPPSPTPPSQMPPGFKP